MFKKCACLGLDRRMLALLTLSLFIGALAPAAAAQATAPKAESTSAVASQSGGLSSADSDEKRIQELVTGNHIIADQGVVDGFGHMSVRSLKNPSHFYLSQSKAPALVTREDIMEFDENSEPVDARGRTPYVERYIHGEIYRARQDVQAIVHSHSPAVIPFGATNVPLRPIMHMAGFLPQATPIFEIRSVAGDDNGILVENRQLGAALAQALGKSPVVLMRGHGAAVVGPTIRIAVFRAFYTQSNAQIESEALKLGPPVFLNSMEAARVEKTLRGLVNRAWEIWVEHANASGVKR